MAFTSGAAGMGAAKLWLETLQNKNAMVAILATRFLISAPIRKIRARGKALASKVYKIHDPFKIVPGTEKPKGNYTLL